MGRSRGRSVAMTADVDIVDEANANADTASDEPAAPHLRRTSWWIAVLLAAALVVAAIAVHFGPDDNSTAAIRSAAPASVSAPPQLRPPSYATDARFGRQGRYIVTGTPPAVGHSLEAVFGSMSDVYVQTVFVRAAGHTNRLRLLSRTIDARSGRFRIDVVIGTASNVASAALPAQAAGPGDARSFGQFRTAGLAIQVYVAGPNTMSLTLFSGDRQVLAGLVGN